MNYTRCMMCQEFVEHDLEILVNHTLTHLTPELAKELISFTTDPEGALAFLNDVRIIRIVKSNGTVIEVLPEALPVKAEVPLPEPGAQVD